MKIEGRFLDGPADGEILGLQSFQRRMEIRVLKPREFPFRFGAEGDRFPNLDTVTHEYEADYVIVQYRWRPPVTASRPEPVTP